MTSEQFFATHPSVRAASLADFPNLRVGSVQDDQAATGLTVILCEEGMAASLDVRGGGPASRDSRILDPLAAAERIHAVVLGGGSAFGLDAAGGVMKNLEARGIGLPVGDACVPLVCQSDIFDLAVGSGDVRPDDAMGFAACDAAFSGVRGNYRDGNFGAGCGASVGKIYGPAFAMKTGIGSAVLAVGPLVVGAIMVVNAAGDVRDPATGSQIAGPLGEDGHSLRSSTQGLFALADAGLATAEMPTATNTTIGAILTNAALSKAQLCKVAAMGHDGMARCISPVHTSMDGDSLYALSVGKGEVSSVPASPDVVGTLGAEAVAQAILCAVKSATSAYGLKAWGDLQGA